MLKMAEDTIADEGQLQELSQSEESGKRLSPPLHGVLVETATTGIIRYPWPLLKPLIAHLLGEVIEDFDATSKVDVGPALPLQGGESAEQLRGRLLHLLDGFQDDAPFTLQRLAEVLLEPRKQYARLDKLALALEKLLLVTSTVPQTSAPPPAPKLSALQPVNENPKTPPLPSCPKSIAAVVSPQPNGLLHDRPAFPGSGFGIAGAVLGTLTAGAASQFLSGAQAPVALTADIDRLQDGTPGAFAANASSTPHIPDASLALSSAPGIASQAAAASAVLLEQPAQERPMPDAMDAETNTPHQQQQNPALQHPQQDQTVQRSLPDAS